ncbi:MAG: leucine-rich repeat domain-containing protein, partial [Ruminococcus sp.]|nr:leucine-rich repeat domain-containing protein [Ruminococcus sp.]
MKKIKKITAGIMALCLMGGFTFIPENIAPIVSITASAKIVKSGGCGMNLAWSIDDEGTFTIRGIGEMGDDSHKGEIPWRSWRESIKKVIIGDGVTSIKEWAFYECTGLTEITIPDSVTSIGELAFLGCTSLTEITIPDSVT